MHYVYDVLVLPANIASNNVEYPVKLGAGIIRHVSIIFPPGCARLVKVTIWNNAEQLLPTNAEAVYGEDSYAVETDCYIDIAETGNDLYVLAWNTGTNYQHMVHVMFDVQGIDEPVLGKSVETLYKTVESLATVLKGFY